MECNELRVRYKAVERDFKKVQLQSTELENIDLSGSNFSETYFLESSLINQLELTFNCS